MGSYRSARRQDRAREFGRRHPRLTVLIACACLAGIIAICAVQIRYGAYLGRGWLIAAFAGMATAAVLSAAILIRSRRHGPELGRVELGYVVLTLMSISSIRYPFPLGPYGRVQAFFNLLKAALLGYAGVTYAALLALLAYALIRSRGRAAPQRPPMHAAGRHELPDDTRQFLQQQMPKSHGWPGWVLAGAAAGLVAGFILAAAGGPHGHDAASTAAGGLILVALAAVCVAVPAALYRRYRSRRVSPAVTARRPHGR